METIECIKMRMSIRQYKPDPVPKEILMEIFDAAKWSPSYRNSQPWETIILSGAKKEALSKLMLENLEQDVTPTPDLPHPTSWPEKEDGRIVLTAKKKSEATGVPFNDENALREAMKKNFLFYSAPHAIYLLQDNSLSQWSLFDMGLFAQTLMLAAKDKGISTVPQAFATNYASDIKKFLSIPETKRLILGISIGYADMESPANQYKTERAETEAFVSWVE
jgi:nitroreductase